MGVGEGKATQSSCYCPPLLHPPCAGTKTLLPEPLEGNLSAPKYASTSCTSLSRHGPNPGLAPSSRTWARAGPSGPPGPALVPHCLSSLQQPPRGGCEHLRQIRPSFLPTALHGSHLPLGKKPKSSQWPVPTLPSPPLTPLQPQAPHCSSNRPSSGLPRGPCTCCAFRLECRSPKSHSFIRLFLHITSSGEPSWIVEQPPAHSPSTFCPCFYFPHSTMVL